MSGGHTGSRIKVGLLAAPARRPGPRALRLAGGGRARAAKRRGARAACS